MIVVRREALHFVSARAATGILEELVLTCIATISVVSAYSVTILGITFTGNGITKILISIFVLIFNYVLSKIWIFKKILK